MNPVTIYTRPRCPYCEQAKWRLRDKGVDYNEIDISGSADMRAEMESRTGRKTVPQILIGDRAVGGSDDLEWLESRGLLDGLLRRRDLAA